MVAEVKRDSKEFRDLQAVWDAKLAKKGFRDIEHRNGNLKSYTGSFFRGQYNPITYQNKQDYYRFAGQFFHNYKFANRREKMIWELHIQAKSIRNIVKEVKKHGMSAYRDIVMHTIHRLAKLMLEKQRSDADSDDPGDGQK